MDLSGQASQARFASYVEAFVEVIGHADRAEPLTRIRRITHKSVGPEAQFRYHFQ